MPFAFLRTRLLMLARFNSAMITVAAAMQMMPIETSPFLENMYVERNSVASLVLVSPINVMICGCMIR